MLLNTLNHAHLAEKCAHKRREDVDKVSGRLHGPCERIHSGNDPLHQPGEGIHEASDRDHKPREDNLSQQIQITRRVNEFTNPVNAITEPVNGFTDQVNAFLLFCGAERPAPGEARHRLH